MSAEIAARTAIRSPRGAAVAGIVFSVLLAVALALVRSVTPGDPTAAGDWLADGSRRKAVLVALNLLPFAGIAFLWFIGVVRDRIGEGEDRLFATVFQVSSKVVPPRDSTTPNWADGMMVEELLKGCWVRSSDVIDVPANWAESSQTAIWARRLSKSRLSASRTPFETRRAQIGRLASGDASTLHFQSKTAVESAKPGRVAHKDGRA